MFSHPFDFEKIIEHSSQCFCIIDAGYRLLYYNAAYCELTGYTETEIYNKSTLTEITPVEWRGKMSEVFGELRRTGQPQRYEKEIVRKDGVRVPVESFIHQVCDQDGSVLYYYSFVTDITRRKRAEKNLRAANRKLLDIIEFLPDATFVIDQDGKVIAWNRAIEEMTGVGKEDMLGKGGHAYAVPFYGEPRPILIDLIFSEDRETKLKYEYTERKDETVYGEVFIPSMLGWEGVYLWGKASPLYDCEGNLIGAIESIRDTTRRKQTEDRLKYLSLHDSLTGLYNRAYFEEELRLFGEKHICPVGIIVCDIDGLKLINDTLGHDAGDLLLKAATIVIKDSFREDDIIARIGGDEFAVLLHGDGKIVENAGIRLKNAIARYNGNAQDDAPPLSISIGFAVKTDVFTSLNIVFKEADYNMSREKLHRKQSTRSAIVQTMMKALEARDFITEGHADRLKDLVTGLARSISLSESKIADLRLLAQFHDIGKVGIPDSILFKKGSLDPEEVAEMQRHSETGYRIAMTAPDLAPIADWILKHHEWWNGQGYPLGLKGEEIPLECRILAIADAYDAMTSDRPYRKALSHEEAVAELKRYSGIQFNPQLVLKFIQVLEKQKEKSSCATARYSPHTG